MSEPVTNAEVEDVLSSIRRLVSEDKRPLQTSNPTPVSKPEAADSADDTGAAFKSMRGPHWTSRHRTASRPRISLRTCRCAQPRAARRVPLLTRASVRHPKPRRSR
ncbi:hypothetical protein CUR85_11360 [Sulfitobacter faviae]|nr:hypothetical protein [Sulfitobacter faviae]